MHRLIEFVIPALICGLLSAFLLSCSQGKQAEVITEEGYLKVDSLIWAEYEEDGAELSELFRKYPEKRDSLTSVSKQLYATASRKNIEAAIKYASVPSGLQRLFMVRLDVSKDTILSVLKSLPDSMQTSSYGKSLLYHVESEQISEGNRYCDFQATDTDGAKFTLSSLEGKQILLIYGGLSCMGAEGRDYLNRIYEENAHHNFEIVVYCPNSDLAGLQQERKRFPGDYLLVSDFLQDHTPMKIGYGAQARPTCFFINPDGEVVMQTIGLDEERIDKELKAKS